MQLASNVLHDQKPIWTFPWKAVRGKHWKPVLAVVAGTVGLVVLDPHTEPYFHDGSRFSAYKTGPLRGRNTTLAETLTPVAFYVTGLVKHSPHARNTGLLAAEGLAGAQIVCFVLKQAAGRLKPSDIPPDGNLRDTWFKYKGGLTNGGSFPSGHSASAFAVATVISERYREHRWIPWVAYGAAAFLSLSRLPDQAHFPSDIFIGAAYGIQHQPFCRNETVKTGRSSRTREGYGESGDPWGAGCGYASVRTPACSPIFWARTFRTDAIS